MLYTTSRQPDITSLMPMQTQPQQHLKDTLDLFSHQIPTLVPLTVTSQTIVKTSNLVLAQVQEEEDQLQLQLCQAIPA